MEARCNERPEPDHGKSNKQLKNPEEARSSKACLNRNPEPD